MFQSKPGVLLTSTVTLVIGVASHFLFPISIYLSVTLITLGISILVLTLYNTIVLSRTSLQMPSQEKTVNALQSNVPTTNTTSKPQTDIKERASFVFSPSSQACLGSPETKEVTQRDLPQSNKFDCTHIREISEQTSIEYSERYANIPVFGIFLDKENAWGHETSTKRFYKKKLRIQDEDKVITRQYNTNTPHSGKHGSRHYRYPDHFVQLAIVSGFLNYLDQSQEAFGGRLSKIAVFASSMGFPHQRDTLLDDKNIYISALQHSKKKDQDLLLIPLYDEGGWHHQCIIIHKKTLIYIEPKYKRKRISGKTNNLQDSTKRAVDGFIAYCRDNNYTIVEQLGKQGQKDGNSCGILCSQSMMEAAMDFLKHDHLNIDFPSYEEREHYRARMRIGQMKMQAYAPSYLMKGEIMIPSDSLVRQAEKEQSVEQSANKSALITRMTPNI